MFSLKEKIALVIGGKGKIGFEISCALAKQGAKVYVSSRNLNIKNDILDIFKDLNIDFIKMDASNAHTLQCHVSTLTT